MPEQKINILLIEDDDGVRASTKIILESEGYRVEDVATGTKALGMVKNKFHDILVVDFRLPDMTGLEFIKQALAISKESVPVIVTGTSSLETAVEGMRAGTHDYLIKPVSADELKKVITNILAEKEEFRKGKARFQQVTSGLVFADENAIEKIVEEPGNRKRTVIVAGNASPAEKIAGVLRAVKRFIWD